MTLPLGSRMEYEGNGSTATYPFTYKIFAATDLVVHVADLDGEETLLVYPSDYTVSAGPWPAGGSITLTAGNLTTGYRLVIRRVRPLTQLVDVRNVQTFSPATVEDTFDDHKMVMQQLQEQIDRCLLLLATANADGALPIPQPGYAIGWNESGTGLTNIPTGVANDVVYSDSIPAVDARIAVFNGISGTRIVQATYTIASLISYLTGLIPASFSLAQGKVAGRGASSGTGGLEALDVGYGLLMSGTTLLNRNVEFDNGNGGASKTIDFANGRQQKLTLNSATCTLTLSNGVVGEAYRLIVHQDGTGGRAITWPSSVKWEGGVAPTVITTASNVTFYSLVCTGTGFLGFAVTQAQAAP